MDPVRRHRGGNALSRTAYQARECLARLSTDEELDQADQTGLVQSGEQIWTGAELAERRFQVVVGRSINVVLPHKLNDGENRALLVRMARRLAQPLHSPVDIAYHKGK